MAKLYIITIRPERDCSAGEIQRGLRWLLKRALRQYGLRCIRVEVKDDACED